MNNNDQVYYISFDTEINPGKIEAVKISIGIDTLADLEKPFRIDLVDHPLYHELEEYVLANPSRRLL